MKRWMLIAGLFFASVLYGQTGISKRTYRSVMALNDSVVLFEGRLKLVNVFRQQVKCWYETRKSRSAVRYEKTVRSVYTPFRRFWENYVGDAGAYAELQKEQLDSSTAILNEKAMLFAAARIDTVFQNIALRIKTLTGHEPAGTWYLAFGHGVTDMGGFGDGTMVLDLFHEKVRPDHVKLMLPHEFNHQIFDHANSPDTTARGLYRCINEGLAVYVNSLFYGDRYTLADHLMYTPEQLQIAYDKEEKLKPLLHKLLFTSSEADARDLANRGSRITPAGPGAIGYFIGYRIVDSYVRLHGRESWKDLYTLPVRDVLARSGYAL